ncbi:protein DMR6-LIKE OXYGENASE 2-like [Carica papaya]|uniref:protein DMR6-LIKE OXYGENASE 2-like n=1 Tax=Carica papaya TaxID=3649 RepID=UPI000B8C77B3|nr:protein DMR6-LIKE OXYGENASE 2-like [Carica papaya]
MKKIRGSSSFFDLTEEEKREYAGKKLFDPIRYGSSFNENVDQTFLWRDYLKIHVHPHFNAPKKPSGFSEIIEEYSMRTREITSDLLKGISEGLGLEAEYIKEKMETERGSQLMVINLYPPCPEPEVAIGMPPHSDHGFLTLLVQNHIQGLQIFHNGLWLPPIPPHPNSFLVNLGDHMEILTNGKYKSVVHRVVVNCEVARISIGTAHGPPLDTVVKPAEQLVDQEGQPLAYRGIKYRDYLELQQSSQLNAKSCLDHVRCS